MHRTARYETAFWEALPGVSSGLCSADCGRREAVRIYVPAAPPSAVRHNIKVPCCQQHVKHDLMVILPRPDAKPAAVVGSIANWLRAH